MTPMEALREIHAAGPPMIEDAWCGVCQRVIHPLPGIDAGPHADSCPWLMMPHIIAVLEATDWIALALEQFDLSGGGKQCLCTEGFYCPLCRLLRQCRKLKPTLHERG